MSEIKVTIELGDELNHLLQSVFILQGELLKRISTPQELDKVFTVPEHPVDAVAPATVEDVKPVEAAPAEPVKTYTLDDVQNAVMDVCNAGKKAEVKKLLNQYAKKVSELKPDAYGEFMAKLRLL